MSETPIDNRERLLGLLADRALGWPLDDDAQLAGAGAFGLDPSEVEEEFARVAALVDLTFVPRAPAMPDDVSVRLNRGVIAAVNESPDESPRPALAFTGTNPAPAAPTAGGAPWPLVGVSWIAAAACLVLAVIAWLPDAQSSPDDQLRTWLENPPADLITRQWAPSLPSDEITGRVQWSNEQQKGFMTITGLDTNDPLVTQYQLWIVDAERDPQFNAVDGGVFDATSGTIVVPIDAKLDIMTPALFAVTTEPPGGVIKHRDDPDLGYRIVITADPTAAP